MIHNVKLLTDPLGEGDDHGKVSDRAFDYPYWGWCKPLAFRRRKVYNVPPCDFTSLEPIQGRTWSPPDPVSQIPQAHADGTGGDSS